MASGLETIARNIIKICFLHIYLVFLESRFAVVFQVMLHIDVHKFFGKNKNALGRASVKIQFNFVEQKFMVYFVALSGCEPWQKVH